MTRHAEPVHPARGRRAAGARWPARLACLVLALLGMLSLGAAGAPFLPAGASGLPPEPGRHGADALAARERGDACGPRLRTIVADGRTFCTIGPEALPEPGAGPGTGRAGRAVACIGDGVSGARFEVLYVHEGDEPSRFATLEAPIQGWVADMDRIFETSAQITGGHRRVRLVTDAACLPVVRDVGVPDGTLEDFGTTIEAVRKAGFDRPDRNYLMFADADVLCGISTIRDDSSAGQGNLNNRGEAYARVDRTCWNGLTASHEAMHNLGGVQLDAPNSTGSWHCTDERDVMCYSDQGPGVPPMRDVCTTGIWSLGEYFDCAEDDYFDTSPLPGTYLADHWNAADSAFLDEVAPEFSGAIVASRAAGSVGDRVVVRIGGFPPHVVVDVDFDYQPLEQVRTGRHGMAAARVRVPAAVGGEHLFIARTGDLTVSTRFVVIPRLEAPDQVRAGHDVQAVGSGFEAGEVVSLSLDGVAPVQVVARQDGGFLASLAIPVGTPSGRTALVADGDAGSRAETTVGIREPTRAAEAPAVSAGRPGGPGRRAGRRR